MKGSLYYPDAPEASWSLCCCIIVSSWHQMDCVHVCVCDTLPDSRKQETDWRENYSSGGSSLLSKHNPVDALNTHHPPHKDTHALSFFGRHTFPGRQAGCCFPLKSELKKGKLGIPSRGRKREWDEAVLCGISFLSVQGGGWVQLVKWKDLRSHVAWWRIRGERKGPQSSLCLFSYWINQTNPEGAWMCTRKQTKELL